MDSVIGNTWMYLCLICAVLLWIVYHKLVHVYYVDLFRGICKEIFFSLFFGILLGTAIMCIFRKNRALAPHERSAVPLGTDHCHVG